MKKKNYTKPAMQVYELKVAQMLCGSPGDTMPIDIIPTP